MLKNIVDKLDEGEERTVGGFIIQKGTSQDIELHIPAPGKFSQFSIDSKLKTQPGIYSAFVGLNDFYGLDCVDTVDVKIENEANFSDKGASASQIQINIYSKGMESFSVNESTVITVDNLNVFFKGAGIVVNFTQGTKKTDSFNEQLYIDLPTQSDVNTHVVLLAQAPNPQEALSLVSPLQCKDKNTTVVLPKPLETLGVTSHLKGHEITTEISNSTLNAHLIEAKLDFKRFINMQKRFYINNFFQPYRADSDFNGTSNFMKGLLSPILYPVTELFLAGIIYPVFAIMPLVQTVVDLVNLEPVDATKEFGAFVIYLGLALVGAVIAVLSPLLALAQLLSRSTITLISACSNEQEEIASCAL